MKSKIAAALFFLALTACALPAQNPHVQAGLISELETIAPGRPFDVALHLKIDEHWHTYGRDPGDAGLPTSIIWDLPPGFRAGEIRWSAPKRFVTGGLTSFGYEGDAYHLVTITPPDNLQPGGTVKLQAKAQWIACADVCVPGEAALSLDLATGTTPQPSANQALFEQIRKTISDNGPPSKAGFSRAGFIWSMVLAFLGGMILNLMPCVFPVLGIKILGFVNQAGEDKRKIALHGLIFTSGVLLSFWVLAGILIALRAGGQQLGWGFQLQSPGFVYFLVVIVFLFALNLSGIFEIGASLIGAGASLASQRTWIGTFFSGVLATVVATPCAAPFLAPALGAALALSPAPSLLLFTCIGLGLSTPYLLLSINPGLLRILPRPGAWMESFRQFMAFPLYATAAFLLWVLDGQVSEAVFLRILISISVLGLAVWIYGRWSGPGRPAGARRASTAAGLLLLAGGLWFSWPTSAGQPASNPEAPSIQWLEWSPEAVEKFRALGKPVYIDFTARWCATCQTNKALVFGSSEVLKKFHELGVVALRADWTSRNPAITRELARWGRSAVPFDLLYLPGRDEPIQLPELLTPGIVLDALQPPVK
ncbi:MAG: protein-disulfide reductase DsbD family protein [Methylacidiphilales bacterium]|nr:protein-disulfide reductase DsbD family protein [Candidatus Methylacidiphilales bacterium]